MIIYNNTPCVLLDWEDSYTEKNTPPASIVLVQCKNEILILIYSHDEDYECPWALYSQEYKDWNFYKNSNPKTFFSNYKIG